MDNKQEMFDLLIELYSTVLTRTNRWYKFKIKETTWNMAIIL